MDEGSRLVTLALSFENGILNTPEAAPTSSILRFSNPPV